VLQRPPEHHVLAILRVRDEHVGSFPDRTPQSREARAAGADAPARRIRTPTALDRYRSAPPPGARTTAELTAMPHHPDHDLADPPPPRQPPPRHPVDLLRRAATRWWAVAAFLLVGAAVTVDPPYTNSPPIRSDGLGYHAWTRAILDGNVSFCPYTELETVGALIPPTEDGRCANKYPPGLALLRFPVMAPFTAANHGALRSEAEDRVNQLASLLAGAVAMVAAMAAARRLGVRDLVANGAALAVMFGTNLFHYATYDSSFTHVYSAALVGTLAWLVVRHAQGARTRGLGAALAVGACVFLLVDMRMMLIAPLAVAGGVLLLPELRRLRSVAAVVRDHRGVLAGAVAGAGLAIVQQLVVNRYIFGRWQLSSYAGEDFIWSQGKQLHVLASIRKGALLWSPLLAVAGAVTLWTRQRLLGGVLLATTLTLAVIYGAWHSWDLAGGFGHRGFVELTPLFAIGLAVALQRVRAAAAAGIVAATVLATVVTLGLMRGYWTGEIGFYGATSRQYVDFGFGSKSFLPHLAQEWLASPVRVGSPAARHPLP